MRPVDLSQAEVVDAHVHPYRVEELLRRPAHGFDTRCTFAWTGLGSSSSIDPSLADRIDELADSTLLALALRRWLAAYLACDPDRDAVTEARDAAFRADPPGYARSLLTAERVTAVLADEGYPQPPVPRAEFEAALGGVPVHRVWRIEPWIAGHLEEGFDDLVSGLEDAMSEAAADPACVAYKTVIAYRTGLDVTHPAPAEASAAYARWRDEGWRESREHSKAVRDFLLRRALAVAKANDRPLHVHCGIGDPDIDLRHAGPKALFPLLVDAQSQPVVLVHSGYPWVGEASAIASLLPNVYLELSELIPWGWSQVEWALEMLVGTVPASKLLHGSDEASEPEMIWLGAMLSRAALGRVLGGFVDRDYLSSGEAERIGRGVLAENARRLHGIAGAAS